ncbi:MAG: carbohydrate ABC transporter permease [Lacrimispora sp.]|uniref:carbohydrate ABC transporter permease n=1 Tax=Lacrimispora sp. TaxID=2719234 RepID=UPI0039E39CEF
MNVKKVFKNVLLWLVLAMAMVIMLYPLFWIFLTSIKTPDDQINLPAYAFPMKVTFDNYKAIFDSMIPVYFKNSIIVTVISLIGIVTMGSLASYPLSKMEFKGRTFVRNYIMMGLMIPIFVALIPLFRIYNELGLINTHWAVILPQFGFALPISMYLFIAFMDQIPNSLIEAAYMDGGGSFRIYLSIILPLSKNTIVTVAIFQFIGIWNEFTFANTFLSTSEMKTIPIGLNDFVNSYGMRDWGLTFAAVAATVLPTLIIFFFLNRQVMSGMTAGAEKG